MRKLLLAGLLTISVCGNAQPDNSRQKGEGLKKMALNDSAIKRLERFRDSAARALQLVKDTQVQEDISRNVNDIIQLEQEQQQRKKNSAMVRIGIGLSLLVVLFVGLMRKRRK